MQDVLDKMNVSKMNEDQRAQVIEKVRTKAGEAHCSRMDAIAPLLSHARHLYHLWRFGYFPTPDRLSMAEFTLVSAIESDMDYRRQRNQAVLIANNVGELLKQMFGKRGHK